MEVISWLSYFFSSRHVRSVVRVYFIVMLILKEYEVYLLHSSWNMAMLFHS